MSKENIFDKIIREDFDGVCPEWVHSFAEKELEKMGIKPTLIILTSTPNGNKGFFYDFWKSQEKDNQ